MSQYDEPDKEQVENTNGTLAKIVAIPPEKILRLTTLSILSPRNASGTCTVFSTACVSVRCRT